ncbi:MAG: hypothetical protein ACRDNP_01825 [Gaiellaceae bacterium]
MLRCTLGELLLRCDADADDDGVACVSVVRMATVARRSSSVVLVEARCSDCGARYRTSAGNAAEARRLGKAAKCETCRAIGRARPGPEAVDRARKWWLENFDLSELRSWPPL